MYKGKTVEKEGFQEELLSKKRKYGTLCNTRIHGISKKKSSLEGLSQLWNIKRQKKRKKVF